MRYEETSIQMACVNWFRMQYPQFAMLLFHVRNESSEGKGKGGIYKAMGDQKGVADLMLPMPSLSKNGTYIGLAIEMKTFKGTQSKDQKRWQKMYEAAGGKYIICRSLEDFQKEIKDYLTLSATTAIKDAYHEIQADIEKEQKNSLQKAIDGKSATRKRNVESARDELKRILAKV